MSDLNYVDFNKDVAREMWASVSVELSNFVPTKLLREGIAIVGTIDIDCVYELNEHTAVQLVVAECELIVDPSNGEFNLMPGLSISPELRAVLTIKLARHLDDTLADAINDCADWIEATEGAPDGFVGDSYDPNAEADAEEELIAVVEGEAEAASSDDNPY